MLLLKTRFDIPLEREYEMWIITDLERRLRQLALQPEIFAVSPTKERLWPADQCVGFSGKLFGLQFKRPCLPDRSDIDIGKVKWPLAKPYWQRHLLARHSELYYCLPTFLNREARFFAADHAIFWRPDANPPSGAWYSNPEAKDWLPDLDKVGHRWGRFLERVLACNAGRRFSEGELYSILDSYRDSVSEDGEMGRSKQETTYVIAMRMPDSATDKV
jgi:hypothetical protein